MSFCSKCGEALKGASFCPSCGTPVNDVAVAHGNNAPSIGLEQMNSLVVHFEPSRPWFNEFHKLQGEIAERASKTYSGMLIIAIIWYILIILLCIVGGTDFLGYILMLVFYGIPGHVVLALRYVFSKRNKKNLLIAQEQSDAVWTKISELYDSYGFCPVEIGFTDPAILDMLYPIVRNGRARTVGDAITILEQDLHNQKVEANAAEAIRLAQETEKAAKQTARAASWTAWNTRRW